MAPNVQNSNRLFTRPKQQHAVETAIAATTPKEVVKTRGPAKPNRVEPKLTKRLEVNLPLDVRSDIVRSAQQAGKTVAEYLTVLHCSFKARQIALNTRAVLEDLLTPNPPAPESVVAVEDDRDEVSPGELAIANELPDPFATCYTAADVDRVLAVADPPCDTVLEGVAYAEVAIDGGGISKHVFHHGGGQLQETEHAAGWYWWDEAGMLGGGPHPDAGTADAELRRYVREVLDGTPPDLQPDRFREWQAANACDVCGNYPDHHGNLEHGRGCYTQSEDGGGTSYIEPPGLAEAVAEPSFEGDGDPVGCGPDCPVTKCGPDCPVCEAEQGVATLDTELVDLGSIYVSHDPRIRS